jgi:hypothetical protein
MNARGEAPLPARPESASNNPEQSVHCAESLSGMSAFQNRQLLTKHQIFKQQAAMRTKYSLEYDQKD